MRKSGKLWASVLLMLLAVGGTAPAQEVVLRGGSGALGVEDVGGHAVLVGESGAGALFANPSDLRLRAGGTAGGSGIHAGGLGNLRIGFDYIRPLWSFRDFTLAVPANQAGAFPILGDTGHVDNHFGFAPRIRYDYNLADAVGDLDFPISEVGTSIFVLNLSGRLQRQLASAGGGSGQLNANSTLTIVTAILPELTKRVPYADLMEKKTYEPWEALQDLQIEFRIGTRFSSIDQNYTGSLTSGANTSTRYSSQSFRGVGITAAVNFILPKGDDWLLFSNTRTSVLVGDNRKDSTLTVNAVGQPAVAEAISQSRSVFLPIVEQEFGLEWGRELALNFLENRPTLITVRTAFTAQFWGDVGPLSAGSTQLYRTSHLFLLGAHIMVGFHR